jgi:hypothetical protein
MPDDHEKSLTPCEIQTHWKLGSSCKPIASTLVSWMSPGKTARDNSWERTGLRLEDRVQAAHDLSVNDWECYYSRNLSSREATINQRQQEMTQLGILIGKKIWMMLKAIARLPLEKLSVWSWQKVVAWISDSKCRAWFGRECSRLSSNAPLKAAILRHLYLLR